MDVDKLETKLVALVVSCRTYESEEEIANLIMQCVDDIVKNCSDVSGSLPITDNDQLNELIKAYNKDKYELIEFIKRVWNNGYNKGYWKGHSNQ